MGRKICQEKVAFQPTYEANEPFYPIFFVVKNTPAWRVFVDNVENIRWGAVIPVTRKQLGSLNKDVKVVRAYDSDREYRKGRKI